MWSPIWLTMLPLLIQTLEFANAASSFCKAALGAPNWPSDLKWASLNHSISGQLLKPSPPGAVCHPERPEYNAAACPALVREWFQVDFYAGDPISSAWPNWSNDSCVPWTPAPCTNAGYPVYVVNATSKEDVKKGVGFARENDVRLIVKATGHDYLGRSTAPNSLSIWTHNLRGISFSKGFQPQGCSHSIDTDAVTIAAGTMMGELNAAAAARNLTILSGGEETVSYGGYVTGGGHAALSATYGLAADQVLQLEIVTPSGDIVIANECKNRDLFWASRGGGGSTFGVITSQTIKAFPSVPLITVTIQIGTAPDSAAYYEGISYWLAQYPYLAQHNIAGYGSTSSNTTVDNSTTLYGGFSGIFLIPAISSSNTTESLVAVFTPIIDHMTSTWGFQYVLVNTTYPSFYDFWLATKGPTWGGIDIMVGSRLLDAKALQNGPAVTIALKAMPNSGLSIYLLSGKGVWNAQPRDGSDAVNPAWRKSLVHSTVGVTWPALDPFAKAEQENLLTNTIVEALRVLAPDTGAYVNEADANEPNFQTTFWGVNYERLFDIKRAVDPGDVFWCTPCVGNERWEEVGDMLCRV